MSRLAAPSVSYDVDRETELQLVRRVRHGDAAAFDVIYDGFNARLLTFLMRLSRHRDVAEDLLEETWLRFVRHAPRLRPDTRLAAWLFTVARNLYVSYVRSRVLEDTASAGAMALWPFNPSPADPSPFEATAASELQRRIERALAALPRRSREVLLLVAVCGLDQSDAAHACGLTPEALRQRLSRARAQLARALEDDSRSGTLAFREAT